MGNEIVWPKFGPPRYRNPVCNTLDVQKVLWTRFVDAVGDGQWMHRDMSRVDPDIVKKYGLKKEFAPGMYMVSFILEGSLPIQNVRAIKFHPIRIYDGDRIKFSTLSSGDLTDYSVNKGGEKVCDILGVKFGHPDGKIPKSPAELVYEYSTEIRPEDIERYAASVGYLCQDMPKMFLASLAAPALLAAGSSRNVAGGFHASESFSSHFPYNYGPLRILIGNEKVRNGKEGKLCSYDLRWIQGDKTVASGRSTVGLLEKAAA